MQANTHSHKGLKLSKKEKRKEMTEERKRMKIRVRDGGRQALIALLTGTTLL